VRSNATLPSLASLQSHFHADVGTTFIANLTPNTYYSFFCMLPANTTADGGYTDVFIYTNPGGHFHTVLFHGVPANQLDALKYQARLELWLFVDAIK
jgi:hypothetical protein